MNNCRIYTLYSGSGGNSVYIETSDTAILIDAGKSARTLCTSLRAIGSDISRVHAIFITHEHNDHIASLDVLEKKNRIPVHITEGSAEKIERCASSPAIGCLVKHPPIFETDVGGIHISSFVTPHDSNMSVGYRITFSDENGMAHTIGIATDIGYVSDDVRCGLTGCDAVVLESNHDITMLKNGSYPYDLKKRILSRRGHLSNRDSADFGAYLVSHGTKSFLLAHLSGENNRPELALDEFTSTIADPRVNVSVASPDEPTELVIPQSCYGEDYLLNAFNKADNSRNS